MSEFFFLNKFLRYSVTSKLGGAVDTGGESSIGGTSALDRYVERSFGALEVEENWTLKSRAERALGSGERESLAKERAWDSE